MRTLTTMLLTLALASCGNDLADEFRAASPSRQSLSLEVPGSSAQALTARHLVASQGQALATPASWYLVTRQVTTMINGATAWVLQLCEAIISFEPTSIDEKRAVWGPYTDPLSPDTFKFTVTKNGDVYEYALEAKPKVADDSAYVTVISGNHLPTGTKLGTGGFLVDWNAAQSLTAKPEEVGTARFAYERIANGSVSITVKFTQVRDDQGQLLDADYGYEQVAGGEGRFDFVIPAKDLQENGSALERFAVRSRWMNDGAGRSDISVSGGDLAAPITGSQCWSSLFESVFDQEGEASSGNPGLCAFATSSYNL